MKNHKSTTLTDTELDSLVYLWWHAPALFSHESLDNEYMPLVQKGYAWVERVDPTSPFGLCVNITQKGKEAVLKTGAIRIVGAYAREGFLHAAEHLIKRLPGKLLPELLAYNELRVQGKYIRYYAAKRLEQLNEREKPKERRGELKQMERADGLTVRLLNCDLIAPGDISSYLLDYNLAWLWLCSYNSDKKKHQVEPMQKMYDFGLDEEVPGDWLVWSESPDKSISVVFDLRVLHDLGVRGHFIINEVGTMTFEKWKISEHFIHTYVYEGVFNSEPDSTIPVTPMPGGLADKPTEEGDDG